MQAEPKQDPKCKDANETVCKMVKHHAQNSHEPHVKPTSGALACGMESGDGGTDASCNENTTRITKADQACLPCSGKNAGSNEHSDLKVKDHELQLVNLDKYQKRSQRLRRYYEQQIRENERRLQGRHNPCPSKCKTASIIQLPPDDVKSQRCKNTAVVDDQVLNNSASKDISNSNILHKLQSRSNSSNVFNIGEGFHFGEAQGDIASKLAGGILNCCTKYSVAVDSETPKNEQESNDSSKCIKRGGSSNENNNNGTPSPPSDENTGSLPDQTSNSAQYKKESNSHCDAELELPNFQPYCQSYKSRRPIFHLHSTLSAAPVYVKSIDKWCSHTHREINGVLEVLPRECLKFSYNFLQGLRRSLYTAGLYQGDVTVKNNQSHPGKGEDNGDKAAAGGDVLEEEQVTKPSVDPTQTLHGIGMVGKQASSVDQNGLIYRETLPKPDNLSKIPNRDN